MTATLTFSKRYCKGSRHFTPRLTMKPHNLLGDGITSQFATSKLSRQHAIDANEGNVSGESSCQKET
ncbi:hypothetical protein ACMYR3_14700 [Ampullimonas aquatilis]|uniref:hypothetical protein n=1 Tax=Ampullimonas aquatilis TaxID=1341549 RepID=UPI003C726FC0